MVLQREIDIGNRSFQSLANVWGFIPERDNVTLTFTGNPGSNTGILDCSGASECMMSHNMYKC